MTFLFIHLNHTSAAASSSLRPCQTALWHVRDIARKDGMGVARGGAGDSAPQKNPTQTRFSNQHQQLSARSLLSIDHLALSSINLQNALFKLLINTLIDLQKCHHSEARAGDGGAPAPARFAYSRRGDGCREESVHYRLPGEAEEFWVEANERGVDHEG